MPSLVLNRAQTREIDRRAVADYGMSSLVLMESAGCGVADNLSRLGARGPVVICCGKGNNGGDGFVVARRLDLRGLAVHVVFCGEPNELSGNALTNFQILQKAGVPMEQFQTRRHGEAMPPWADAEWIVNALLGTGARDEPRSPVRELIELINASAAPKLAVDIPSGLDCDTGTAASSTVRARHTCTFVALKPGLIAPGVDVYTGDVHVLDIGVPRRLIEEVASGH